MKNKVKTNQSGITLIALIITIIVLVILAVVTINTVHQDKIIEYATNGTEGYLEAAKREESDIDETAEVLKREINEIKGGNSSTIVPSEPPKEEPPKEELPELTTDTKAGTKVKKPAEWQANEKIVAIADGEGNYVPLPEGYYYIGGNYNEGIVISDKSGDTMTASGISSGNQFVWIPVPDESYLKRTNFDDSGSPTTGLSIRYTEPYVNGYAEEEEEYNEMETQVIKYGGFYIGRYEAGVNNTTLRTGETNAQDVVSKKGVAPYNYVPWGTSMSDISEIPGKSGAMYLAKNKYNHPDSVTSVLCYSSQWDAMCRYIGDSNRYTPSKSAPELTGSVLSDVSKNIYDLAGNCYEWTSEAYSASSRVLRGGGYDYEDPVASRLGGSPYTSEISCCFRLTLYIK